MNKILILLFIIIYSFNVNAQTTTANDNIIARKAFTLTNTRLDSIQTDINFTKNSSIPTSKAVRDFVNSKVTNQFVNKLGSITESITGSKTFLSHVTLPSLGTTDSTVLSILTNNTPRIKLLGNGSYEYTATNSTAHIFNQIGFANASSNGTFTEQYIDQLDIGTYGYNIARNNIVGADTIGSFLYSRNTKYFPSTTTLYMTPRSLFLSKRGLGTSFSTFPTDTSSILNIVSTEQGVLLPRMNTAQQNAIVTPAQGLVIFNTDSLEFCKYNGTIWRKVGENVNLSFQPNSVPYANGAGLLGSDNTHLSYLPASRVLNIGTPGFSQTSGINLNGGNGLIYAGGNGFTIYANGGGIVDPSKVLDFGNTTYLYSRFGTTGTAPGNYQHNLDLYVNHFRIRGLSGDSAALTNVGTTHMVTVDANGQFNHQPILDTVWQYSNPSNSNSITSLNINGYRTSDNLLWGGSTVQYGPTFNNIVDLQDAGLSQAYIIMRDGNPLILERRKGLPNIKDTVFIRVGLINPGVNNWRIDFNASSGNFFKPGTRAILYDNYLNTYTNISTSLFSTTAASYSFSTDGNAASWGIRFAIYLSPGAPPATTTFYTNNILNLQSEMLLNGVSGLSGQVPTAQGIGLPLIWGTPSAGGGSWGTITGTLSSQTDLATALNGKEASLGNPATSGFVLSSTIGGVRSWIANGSAALSGTGYAKFSGTTPSYISLIPIADGGTGVSSVTGAPVPSTFVGWDPNKNVFANNHVNGYTTTVTAAGTTTLTASSTYEQFFTGSANQIVVLPSNSNQGMQFYIRNNSTGTITINSSAGNLVRIIGPTTRAMVTSLTSSGTTGADWSANYLGGIYADGKTLTINNTTTINGTDGAVVNVGGGGTLGTAAYTSSSAYVPYSGATGAVNLGSQPLLTSGQVTVPTASAATNAINRQQLTDSLTGNTTTISASAQAQGFNISGAGPYTFNTPSGLQIFTQAANSIDADFTPVINTITYLPAATLTTNRTITMPTGTLGQKIFLNNKEAGFSWLLAGSTVYYTDGVTPITQLYAKFYTGIEWTAGARWELIY